MRRGIRAGMARLLWMGGLASLGVGAAASAHPGPIGHQHVTAYAPAGLGAGLLVGALVAAAAATLWLARAERRRR